METGSADLDAIVGKALEFEAQRRYGSAGAFAADLVAWLEQRVVSARRPTVFYRLGRFALRNSKAVAAGTAAAVLLMGMGGYAFVAAAGTPAGGRTEPRDGAVSELDGDEFSDGAERGAGHDGGGDGGASPPEVGGGSGAG